MTAMPKVAGLSRLRKELMQLDRDPPPGIICYQKDDNDMTRLESYISGPPESPYQAGRFRLDLQIPEKYPFEPPQIRFHTKIYHPNIDDGGRICADILKKGKWAPSMTISSTLMSLAQLMAHPNPDDPLDADIAKQFQLDYPGFLKKAKEWTLKYAHDEDEDDHKENDKENSRGKNKEDDVNYHSQTATSTTASLTRKTNEEQVDDQEEDEVEETIKPKKIFSLSRKKTGNTQPSSPPSLPPSQKKSEINTPLRLAAKKKILPHSKAVTDKKEKDNGDDDHGDVDKKEPEIMELDDSDVDTDMGKNNDNNNNDNVSSSDNDDGDDKKELEEKGKEGKDADHDNHNDIAIAIDSDDDGTDDDGGNGDNGDNNGNGGIDENGENDNDNHKKEPEEEEKEDSIDVDMDDKDDDDSKKNSQVAIIDLENEDASSPPHEALDLAISESPFYIDTTRMRLIVVDGEEPGSRPIKRKKLNLSLSKKKKKI